MRLLQTLLFTFQLITAAHFAAAHFTAALRAETLLLEVVDPQGAPLPARVLVRDKQRQDYLPQGGLEVPLGNDRWFVTPGSSQLEVPSGPLLLRVEHGHEFLPCKQAITCEPTGKHRHRVELQRWINMEQRGYACGENHLHVPLETLGPQLAAEGLDFGTSLQWWNARKLPTSANGGPVRMLKYAGATIPTTVFDYEIEHDWGAVYVVGQRMPLDRADVPQEPNLSTLQRSHEQGALVCYQGGWSREVLLDALLGCVDVVNVGNNNFLRHAYQPRSRYSNLLKVPGFPTYANTAPAMWRMNTETYYRLLNCGLRLAAGAGSATGAKRTPVGYNRAYVRVSCDANSEEFLDNWRRGKNFVTNGPMLFLRVNQQARPGDTMALDQAGVCLHVEVEALFPDPLTDLELVMNGQVVHHVSQPKSGVVIRLPITINESAWLIARCTAADPLLSDKELAEYAWGSPKVPRRPTRLRFAHTSPVYLSLQGKPVRVRKSVREAHQMLDALERFAAAHTTAAMKAEVAAALNTARERLED